MAGDNIKDGNGQAFFVKRSLLDDIIGRHDINEFDLKGGILMQITDAARDMLKQVLQEQNAPGIRVFFSGYG